MGRRRRVEGGGEDGHACPSKKLTYGWNQFCVSPSAVSQLCLTLRFCHPERSEGPAFSWNVSSNVMRFTSFPRNHCSPRSSHVGLAFRIRATFLSRNHPFKCFSRDCIADILERLEIDQAMHSILACETWKNIVLVFPDAAPNVIGNADVPRLACHDVNVVALHAKSRSFAALRMTKLGEVGCARCQTQLGRYWRARTTAALIVVVRCASAQPPRSSRSQSPPRSARNPDTLRGLFPWWGRRRGWRRGRLAGAWRF
jgi:hypothetical protein